MAKLKKVGTRNCFIVCAGATNHVTFAFFNVLRRAGFKWHVHEGVAFIYVQPVADPNNVLQEG